MTSDLWQTCRHLALGLDPDASAGDDETDIRNIQTRNTESTNAYLDVVLLLYFWRQVVFDARIYATFLVLGHTLDLELDDLL